LADRQTAAPWSVDTGSQIASISKQFVAAVTLMLAERGALNLDDPVSTLLPEAPRGWDSVTLQELLTHTSGLPHWCALPGFDPSVALPAVARLQHFLAAPGPGDAGRTWQYSSPGYVVLSAVVERAARRRYADLVRELVIDPLALAGTTVGERADNPVARGYSHGEPVAPWDLTSMPGTGDVWSTARDIATFVTALHDGGLLPPRARALLREIRVPIVNQDDGSSDVATQWYGLGHFIGTVGGRNARLHPGDNPGYQSLAAWLPETRTAVVLLSNDEADDLEGVLSEAVQSADDA
jgi:CubicO group peptidase (beta-lactamase class C family)